MAQRRHRVSSSTGSQSNSSHTSSASCSFPDELSLHRILGVTRRNQLCNDMIQHRCIEQPTVGKRVQWNRLRWFGHVCRIDDSRLPKQLLWAERPVGWRCPPNAPRKRWKDRVFADVMTHLSRRLYLDPLMAAVGMTTEHGAWRGLHYDIVCINRPD